MNDYDNGYPTKPIGGGNPYSCCVSCGISTPQINGKLENHSEECEYRKRKEMEQTLFKIKEENDWLKYILKQIIQSLPQRRDWLDPGVEKVARHVTGD